MPDNRRTLATLSVRLEALGYRPLANQLGQLNRDLQQTNRVGEQTTRTTRAMGQAAQATAQTTQQQARASTISSQALQQLQRSTAQVAQAQAQTARTAAQVTQANARVAQSSNNATAAKVRAAQAALQVAQANVRNAQSAQQVAQANVNIRQTAVQQAAAQVRAAQTAQGKTTAQQRQTVAGNRLAIAQQRVQQASNRVAIAQARARIAAGNYAAAQQAQAAAAAQAALANNAVAQSIRRVGTQTRVTDVSLRGFRRVLEGSVYTASVVGRAFAALESGTALLVASFAFLSSAIVASLNHMRMLEMQLRPLQARSQLTYETLQTLGNTIQALGLDRGGGGGGAQQLQMGFEAAAEASQELRTRLGELEQFGTGPARDALRALNIELEELLSLSQDDRLFFVINALQQIPTVSLRQHLAEELLGDTGAEGLATVLNSSAEEMRLWGETVARLRANLSTNQLREARRLNDAWQETRLALNATWQELGEVIAPVVTDIIRHFSALLQGIRIVISTMREIWANATGFLSESASRRAAGVTGGAVTYRGGQAAARGLQARAAAELTSGVPLSRVRRLFRGINFARGIAGVGRFAGGAALAIPAIVDTVFRATGLRQFVVQSQLDEVRREIARIQDPGQLASTGRDVADRQLETDRLSEIEEFESERSVLRARSNQRLTDLQNNYDRQEARALEDHNRNKARIIRNYNQSEERRAEENAERRLDLIRRYDLREAALIRRADDARARAAESDEERITRIRDRAQERRERALLRHKYRLEDIERNASRDLEDAQDELGHSFAQFNIRQAEIERDTARDREDALIRHERELSEIKDDEQQSRVDLEQEQADRIAEINRQLARDLALLAEDRAYQLQQFDVQVKRDSQLRAVDHAQNLSDIEAAYALTSSRRAEDLELSKFSIIQSGKRAELELTIQHHMDIQRLEAEHAAKVLEIHADLSNMINQLGLPEAQRRRAQALVDQNLLGGGPVSPAFGGIVPRVGGSVPTDLLNRRRNLETELALETTRVQRELVQILTNPSLRGGLSIAGGGLTQGIFAPINFASSLFEILRLGRQAGSQYGQRQQQNQVGSADNSPIVIQGFDRESIRRAFLEVYDRGRRRGQLSPVT